MQVENLIPVLDVRDVETSVTFYCEVLGFTLVDKVEWAGKTEWALLRTGQVQLMLCASQDYAEEDEQRVNEGIFFLHLDNPDALIVRLKKRDAAAEVQPEAKLGSKDFYLRDPDGYILWLSHRPPVQDRSESPQAVSVSRKTAAQTQADTQAETENQTDVAALPASELENVKHRSLSLPEETAAHRGYKPEGKSRKTHQHTDESVESDDADAVADPKTAEEKAAHPVKVTESGKAKP